MAQVDARIKIKNKHYEIAVDLEEALKVKEGKGNVASALQSPNIFYDLKKGTLASSADLKEAFGTIDVYQIAQIIMTKGEVQKNQEYRDAEKEKKFKQIISLILRNAVDQHGKPFTEERLKTAFQNIHYNIDNRPAEQQMLEVFNKLKEIIPIKIETKKIKLIIPARFTGQAYGLLKDHKESEDWLANGDLQVIMNIPPGMLIDFYEKLNSITHGAAQSEEIK